MEYPIHAPDNNLYANRMQHHHLPPSPLLDGGIGSAPNVYSACALEEVAGAPINVVASGDGSRLHHDQPLALECHSQESSPLRSSPGSPQLTPNGVNLSADVSYTTAAPYASTFPRSGPSPYHGTITGSTTTANYPFHPLGHPYANAEAYSATKVLYGGGLHSGSVYNQYSPCLMGSNVAVDTPESSSVVCRLNERHSPPNISYSNRSDHQQCSGGDTTNTYDWMKIKRNPPKNGKRLF